jgi:hypothetical protein
MTTSCGSPRLCIAACAASFVLTLAGPAFAQSLGELAREEAARRSAAPEGKVYTNADLPATAPAPAAAAGDQTPSTPATPAAQDDKGTAGAADAKAGAKSDATKKDEKKDEAYWREHMKAAREGKARAESFAEALQSRINALSTDFVNRDDPAQRNVIAADRQKAIDELARVKKEIADYTKSIDDLQTEARREGVPAGWLR